MKLTYLFLSILLSMIAFSCSEEESSMNPDMESEIEDIPIEEGRSLIPKVGDKRYYTLYIGNSYFNEDPETFRYTGDTLIVEVVDSLESNVFVIKEYISRGSSLFQDSNANYFWLDPKLEKNVTWTIQDEFIEINGLEGIWGDASFLSFHLNRINTSQKDSTEMDFSSWVPIPKIGDHCREATIQGVTYDYLSVTLENGPMAFDGPGMTLLYSEEKGIVRSFGYSAWTGAIIGWDLITN